jgi:DNA primase
MKARTRTEVILAALKMPIIRNRGRRAWARCPFHEGESKIGTFFVRTQGERAGNYHCFACKAGGSLVELVMRFRACDRPDAIAFIKKAGKGFEAPRARVRVVERPAVISRRRFAMPREVLFDPFDDWVSMAQRSATERGITADVVERFGIGYAVDARLAGRLVFPVRKKDGSMVSYSARSFVGDEPKYLTPHESEAPELDAFFGEHLWPEPGDRDVIAITEGAIDGMSVWLVAGNELAFGTLGGSDVRPGHILELATFEHVIVMTDADEPGDKAARVIEQAFARSTTTRTTRVRLEGEDANKMYLRRPSALRERILTALEGSAS